MESSKKPAGSPTKNKKKQVSRTSAEWTSNSKNNKTQKQPAIQNLNLIVDTRQEQVNQESSRLAANSPTS